MAIGEDVTDCNISSAIVEQVVIETARLDVLTKYEVEEVKVKVGQVDNFDAKYHSCPIDKDVTKDKWQQAEIEDFLRDVDIEKITNISKNDMDLNLKNINKICNDNQTKVKLSEQDVVDQTMVSKVKKGIDIESTSVEHVENDILDQCLFRDEFPLITDEFVNFILEDDDMNFLLESPK